MKYKCIIVDDEPLAVELIENYLQNFDNVEIAATFENAMSAFSFLQKNAVDLMFLDMQMPQLGGMELIRSLKKCPKVIITSAHRDYAADSYEQLEVLDYLLKPIRLERFMKAMSRFYQNTATQFFSTEESETSKHSDAQFIFVRADRKIIKINLNQVLYIESIKDYVKIVTDEKPIISKQQISELEKELPEGKFIRIHRSFIVAKNKISAFTAQEVEVGNKILPIGRSYKLLFEQWMKK